MTTSNRTRKTAKLEETPVALEAAPEPQPQPQPVAEKLKPFEIDVNTLTLGDLEFMEDLAALEASGKSPGTKQIFELFTRFFVGFTLDDCRKIRLNQVEEVKQELFKAIQKAVPNGKGTAS